MQVLFELLTGQSALDRVTMETGEETDLVSDVSNNFCNH